MIRAALSRWFKPKAEAPVVPAPTLTLRDAARAMGQRSAAAKRSRARQKIIDTALEIRALHNMPEWQPERKNNG